MRSTLRALAVVGSCVGLAGCYTTKYYSSDTSSMRQGDVHRVYVNSFFWGLVSLGQVNLDGYCGPAGVHRVRSHVGGLGLLGHWITGGIWTPMQVKIVCASPSVGEMLPTEAEIEAVAEHDLLAE